MIRWRYLAAAVFSAVIPFSLHAQQPGSVQYNTVTMPAMQAAQSRYYGMPPPPRGWFAVAKGESVEEYGAVLSRDGMGAAEREAMALCEAHGGDSPCELVVSEGVTGCAAFAVDKEHQRSGWAWNYDLKGGAAEGARSQCRSGFRHFFHCKAVFKECVW